MFPLTPLCRKLGGRTVLLLHGDGADGSTTFTDNSQSPHTFTPAGNAQIDTGQSVFGGASMQFDGTGDWLLGDGSQDFAFGDGDFTIDFRVRFANLTGFQGIYDTRDVTVPLTISLDDSTNQIQVTGPSSGNLVTAAVSATAWYHVALTRQARVSRLFLDGVLVASGADTSSYTNKASRPTIGCLTFSDTPGFGLNGHLDEFRVIKGAAKWTSNFTPPAAPYGHLW